MRWLLPCLLLSVLGLAQALSSSGSRLLVVIEEAGEKDKYSNFWADLEGKLEASYGKVRLGQLLNFLQDEDTSFLSSPQRTRSSHCFNMESALTTT